MKPTDILDRTDKGQEEIHHRRHKLASRQRMLLLLVDGIHTAEELSQQASKIGLPATALTELVSQGYVALAAPKSGAAPGDQAPSTFERYRKARQFMNDSIVNAMGLRSFFFTLKIEKTANLADLHGLFGDYIAAMKKALGESEAEVLIVRMRELLR